MDIEAVHMSRRELAQRAGLAFGCFAVALIFAACDFTSPKRLERRDAVGEPEQGRTLLFAYGCVSCHEIPGFSGHPSHIGPPLRRWRERKYIAGLLPNREENLIRWITRPDEIEPGTAMPDLGVTEAEALDMAAYLYAQ